MQEMAIIMDLDREQPLEKARGVGALARIEPKVLDEHRLEEALTKQAEDVSRIVQPGRRRESPGALTLTTGCGGTCLEGRRSQQEDDGRHKRTHPERTIVRVRQSDPSQLRRSGRARRSAGGRARAAVLKPAALRRAAAALD